MISKRVVYFMNFILKQLMNEAEIARANAADDPIPPPIGIEDSIEKLTLNSEISTWRD